MKLFRLLLLLLVCATIASAQYSAGVAPTTRAVRDSNGNWKIYTEEPPPGAATVALAGAGAGNVENGAHRYRVTFVTAEGETSAAVSSSAVTVVDKTANGKVSLSSIPTGTVFVTARKVYRTLAGGTVFKLLTTIANNSATTYTDNTADGSLTTTAPNANTTANPILSYTGSTGAVKVAGASLPIGTVTSVAASGGTETTTGSAITSTGTIRSVQTIRTAAGDPTVVLDADRGKVLNVTFAGGSEIDIAQAGTAGSFASGWYTDVKCSGAGGCQIIPTVSTINGAAFYNLTNGQTVRVVSDGTNYKTTITGGSPISGLTTNTVPKATSATAIGNSRITDDGTDININSGAGVTTIGDVGGVGNTALFTLDDVAQTATFAGVDLNFSGGGLNGTGPIRPSVTGQFIGTTSLPYASVYVGNAANNSSQITGTFSRNNTTTLQDIDQTLIGRGASVALTGQTASIGSTNIEMNGGVVPAGLYRLTYYLLTTTQGTSGTVTATFGWRDVVTRSVTSATVTFGTLAAPATGTVIIQANGSANVTYLTSVTASVGGPQYSLQITLERLQ